MYAEEANTNYKLKAKEEEKSSTHGRLDIKKPFDRAHSHRKANGSVGHQT